MSKPPLTGMDELLQRLLDGQIDLQEMARLEQAMQQDKRVRDYYVESMIASAVLRRSSQVTGELTEPDLIRAISTGEDGSRSRRSLRRLYRIAAVLVLGLLTIVSISLLTSDRAGPSIGKVVGAYEMQWSGTGPQLDGPVYTGRYHLSDGMAQIQLDRGTKLLLEAPCSLELVSADQAGLSAGRLAVEVSAQGKGFQVKTPMAVITDLGTEFGVVVYPDGSLEAHVIKGSISVDLDPDIAPEPASMVVAQGRIVTVDPTGRTMRSGQSAEQDTFQPQLPPQGPGISPTARLNLADIVGGGDGTGSGAADTCIDLGTGLATGYPVTVIRRARQNEFIVTGRISGIDGVFVPNGALGPVVVSSTGLVFEECPDTLGSYYGGPANSGRIYDIPGDQVHTARLNGVRLGTTSHPALNLHPNAGITFDLDEIRAANPDVRIERFTAMCGIPMDLPQWPFSPADVWVLLDGEIRQHLRFPTGWSIARQLDVPIDAEVRFLTLAATCYGRADYCWVFFGDPFLGPANP